MVEVFKAISRDGSACYFGDKAAAAAWAGTRGRVEWEQFPEPPEFGVITGGGDPLAEVFNVMGIGSQARSIGVLLANIENMQRRDRCLSAIEREFFTVATPPDPDEDGDEPGEKCLLRWADDPAEYVERFRRELPGAVARGVMVDGEAQRLAEIRRLAALALDEPEKYRAKAVLTSIHKLAGKDGVRVDVAPSSTHINELARQAGLPMSWLDTGKASAWPELERFARLLLADGVKEGGDAQT